MHTTQKHHMAGLKKKLATNRMMLDSGNKSWILPLRMKMKGWKWKKRV